MKRLHIEWKHLEENGKTCTRCSQTRQTLNRVIGELAGEPVAEGVIVTFTETKLPKTDCSQSNSLFFNGVSFDEIMPDLHSSENYCPSCSDLTGKETFCRTVESNGTVHEDLPEHLVKTASLKVLRLINPGL